MYRRRYQVASSDLIDEAEKYPDHVIEVREARQRFMEQHGADSFHGVMPGDALIGFSFKDMPPEGWSVVDDAIGRAVPDIRTQRGYDIEMELRDLPQMPSLATLSRMIGFDPVKKAAPGENGNRIVGIGVERMDGEIYVSVPNFSPEEIRLNAGLTWSQPDELTEVNEDEYLSVQRKAARHASSLRPAH